MEEDTSLSLAISLTILSQFLVLYDIQYSLIACCLLKQQSMATVYHLPTKENKRSFSVFICSKEMEVCRFCFPFAAIKSFYLKNKKR
jgi:hypothetical protein